MRNAAAAARTAAPEQARRDGLADSVIQHAASGITSARPPLSFTAAARPAAAPASAKERTVGRSCAARARSIVSATKNVSGVSVST